MNNSHTWNTPEEVLEAFWGFGAFRDFQQGPVRDLCAGKDVLAVLPTGGGKTVCYQVPGLFRGGMCLVISPLIALMKDQIEGLKRKGIRCDAVTAEGGPRDAERALENAAVGALQFLYVSPERLKSEAFLARIDRMPIRTIAIDEAHCISQWGHDFRPAYRDIASLRALKPDAVWGAFTATATPDVFEDIADQLQLHQPAKHRSKMRRANLHYGACHVGDAQASLIEAVKQAEGTGLVYVGTRIAAERWADRLQRAGVSAMAYHAGLEAKEKADRQRNWIEGRLRVMTCTSAFGMGIDKPDVRWVFHAHLPADLESYVQEAGRAGRDGAASTCVVFPDDALFKETSDRLERRFPTLDFIQLVYQALANQGPVAVGDQPSEPTRFALADWCRNHGHDARNTTAALQLLVSAGYIKADPIASVAAGKWQLLATSEQCTEWIENQRWGWEFLDALRRHPEARAGMEVHPKRWAERHHLPQSAVVQWMERWDRMGIGEWRPIEPGWRIQWLEPRRATERIFIPASAFEERRDLLRAKWQKVQDYLAHPGCRAQFLDAYFGSGEAPEPCGVCDHCRALAWKGEDWVRKQVPLGGMDGHALVRSIPLLLKDAGIEALQSMRNSGALYSRGNQIYLTD